MADKGQNTQSERTNIPKKVHLLWTPDRDDVLLDALLDEQAKENRIGGSWTSSAYANVERVLQSKLGNNYTKAHVKNRMKTLKMNFNLCYELFKGLSGFLWKPTTLLFETEDEVWKELLEPQALKWKSTKISNYEKMYDIFARDHATGEGSMTAAELSRRWAREGGATAIDMESEADQFTIGLDKEPTPTSTPSHVQTDSTSGSRKSGKRKSPMTERESKKDAEPIRDGMALVVDAIKDASLKVGLGNTFLQTVSPEVYSEKRIFEELVNIGLDEQFRLDTFVYLI